MLLRLGPQRFIDAVDEPFRHGRYRGGGQDLRDLTQRGELSASLLRLGKPGAYLLLLGFVVQLSLSEEREGLGVYVRRHDLLPPPFGDGTFDESLGFLRWARYGRSLARPRAHRLFTVPGATSRIFAASSTR